MGSRLGRTLGGIDPHIDRTLPIGGKSDDPDPQIELVRGLFGDGEREDQRIAQTRSVGGQHLEIDGRRLVLVDHDVFLGASGNGYSQQACSQKI